MTPSIFEKSATMSPIAEGKSLRTEAPAPARRFGHIVSVAGSQAVAVLESATPPSSPTSAAGETRRVEIGALVKIRTATSHVVGIVSAVSSPMPDTAGGENAISLVELLLVGELIEEKPLGKLKFRRGVANFPAIGDPALFAERQDLNCVYVQPDVATIEVGTLYQDVSVPARFLVDDLFSKHFIIVGATGCGKSSALTCILRRVLSAHEHAHILVLDIHSEYQKAFGDKAELVTPANLHLPFWLLNFQELSAAIIGNEGNHDAEIEILSDAIITAKRKYAEAQTNRLRKNHDVAGMTVDTPTPFRLSDVVAYLDEQLGRLERVQSTLPYRRLKSRIEGLINDTRYSFMFGNLTVEDTMASVLGRIFRVPIEGRPITVIDLATVPAEILDVVISLISRLAFDLAVWSEGALPMLLVCEEAHRYAPANASDRFLPTRQALSRLAKEGRKYGISLALVTQRPSDLDTTILSQCGTVIAMRLATERDQQVMRGNAHDSAFDLLDYLPLLADREAIVLGQGVAMPMRIRFADLTSASSAGGSRRGFSQAWKSPNMDRSALDDTVARWRSSGRTR